MQMVPHKTIETMNVVQLHTQDIDDSIVLFPKPEAGPVD